VWFAAQTIQNACGTQALLSVLLNKDGSSEDGNVDIGPNLREFKEFTSGFPADVCCDGVVRITIYQLADTLCSSVARHSQTRTSFATPTILSHAARHSSATRPAQQQKMTTSITSSHIPQ
jgi:hypothetical protein